MERNSISRNHVRRAEIRALSQHRSPLWGEGTASSTVLLRHCCEWEHAIAPALTPWSKYPFITRSSEHGRLSWVILQLKKIKATIFFSFLTPFKGTFLLWPRPGNIRAVTSLLQPATVYKSTTLLHKGFWTWSFHLCISGIFFLRITPSKWKITYFSSSLSDFPIILPHFVNTLVLPNATSSVIIVEIKWKSYICNFKCPQTTHSCNLKRMFHS